MQELEKILEEINQEKLKHWDSSERLDTDKLIGWCFDRCIEIIRKHMNYGWIPVEDRDHLPEVGEHVLVSIGTGFNLEKAFLSEDVRWTMLHAPEGCRDINDMVDAWMPLPKPYRPEEKGGE